MASPGLRATIAVVALVLVGVAFGSLGALELSQPSSTTTTTSTSYTMNEKLDLNVSTRPPPTFSETNQTNPPSIFSNVTTSLSVSSDFQFAASQPLAVAGTVSFDTRFYSGTTPPWSMSVNSSSRPLIFNSSLESTWFSVPMSLPTISSVLNQSSAIDRELNVVFGAGTLVVNASFELDLPGGILALNNTSVELTFDYPAGQGSGASPAAYSAINPVYSSPALASGHWANSTTVSTGAGSADIYLAIAGGALVAAAVIGVMYLPRQRPSTLQRFLADNAETVVRVEADSRMNGSAVRVKDLSELVKLANLADQPIFLFESPKGALLYVIQGTTTFAYSVPSEKPQEPTAS